MNYRTLGNTGLKVSELCLGTMTFGSDFFNIAEVDQSGATQMVERSIEAGINFFDTANMYSYGESEEILGQALQDLNVGRRDVVIATKVRGPMSEEAATGEGDVNNVGLSRKHIFEACEASLDRLGMDYVDLYQVHGWDPHTPIEETLSALNDLVRRGWVRYIGCSNWPARHLMKALMISERRSWAQFDSLQAYYSLGNRDLEHELLPLCREEGLGVLPWSPLSGGFLTGKFRRDGLSDEDTRRAEFDFPPVYEGRAYDAVEEMDKIADAHGASIPRVALAWLLEREGISSVIIGARTMEQLEDNLAAARLNLSEEEVSRLSSLTDLPPIYPEWMVHMQTHGELPETMQS